MMDENSGRIEVKIFELAAFYKGLLEDDVVGTINKLNKNIEFATCVDKRGRNALMYALYAHANEVAKALLGNNIIPPGAEDLDGFTSYDWAVLGNNALGCRIVEHWWRNMEEEDRGF